MNPSEEAERLSDPTLDSERPRSGAAPRRADSGIDLGFDLPAPRRLSRTRSVALGLGLVGAVGTLLLVGYLPKRHAAAALRESAAASVEAVRKVEVMTPKSGSSSRAVVLPGSVRPLEETVVYPRANGYVRAWKVDLGDKVKDGDVLAEIDTPELDQQLEQARAELEKTRAALAQAEVSRDLAEVTFKRSSALVSQGLSPEADLEDKQAQREVSKANVRLALANVSAAQASVRQLGQLKAYSKVTAPFAGTINARSIERGALVSPATPLFTLAATDTVRVFVSVPQNLAPSVRVGAVAEVSVRESPGKKLEGTVARTAGSLDGATRTLNTEVRVPNTSGELLAGMYAQVSLKLATPHQVLEIPATALWNDAQGLRVAVVDAENKVRFRPVTIERDAGATIELASGLDGTERIVRVASATLTEGLVVEPKAAPPAAPQR